jgi:hypothetical protein
MGYAERNPGVSAGRACAHDPNASGPRRSVVERSAGRLEEATSAAHTIPISHRPPPACGAHPTGSQGLLDALLQCFKRLSRSGEVRHALLDDAGVIKDLSLRPTHVTELTQQPLDYAGYCEVSAFGAEGVWFGANAPLFPIRLVRTMAPGHYSRRGVRLKPQRPAHKFGLGNGGSAITGSRPKSQARNISHGGNSDRDWLGQLRSRRLDDPNGITQLLPHLIPPAERVCDAPANDPIRPTSSLSCRQNPKRPCRCRVPSRPVSGVAAHFHLLENSPGDMCPETFPTRPWHNVQPTSDLWSNVIATLHGQRSTLQRWTIKSGAKISETGQHTPARATPTRDLAPTPSRANKKPT